MHPSTPWWERLIKSSVACQGSQGASARFVSEATFRELLAAERVRSERSGDHCRILIIHKSSESGVVVPIGGKLLSKVMTVLSTCLRRTDSVGWYREGTIVGALLTVVERESFSGQCHLLERRMSTILRTELPDAFDLLRLRICTPEEIHEFDGC